MMLKSVLLLSFWSASVLSNPTPPAQDAVAQLNDQANAEINNQANSQVDSSKRDLANAAKPKKCTLANAAVRRDWSVHA